MKRQRRTIEEDRRQQILQNSDLEKTELGQKTAKIIFHGQTPHAALTPCQHRLFFDCSPIVLRLFFDFVSENNRRTIGEQSKNRQRRLCHDRQHGSADNDSTRSARHNKAGRMRYGH
ncbi:MAG: hypothetical protein IJ760_03550 [Bacteroidales bacterium]|nr:hypothetical protein [Bacteroidales bacterium]